MKSSPLNSTSSTAIIVEGHVSPNGSTINPLSSLPCKEDGLSIDLPLGLPLGLTTAPISLVFGYLYLGVGMLVMWNVMLNSVFVIQNVLWPEKVLLPSICTFSFDGVAFVVMVVMSALVNPLQRGILYIGAAFSTTAVILWMTGALLFVSPIMPIAACCGGIGIALLQATGFAYAATSTEKKSAAAASLGNGLAGMLSLIIWTVTKQFMFRSESIIDSRLALSILSGAGLMILGSQFLLIPWITQEKYMKSTETVRCQSEPLSLDAHPLEESSSRGKIFEIVKKTRSWLFHLSWTVYITMAIFPNIGPFTWKESFSEVNIATGIVQVTDCLGRLVAMNKALSIKSTTLKNLNLLRSGFLVLALGITLLCDRSTAIVGNFFFHGLILGILGISNGYFSTVELVRLPENLVKQNEKAIATAIGTTFMVGSISLGLLSSYAIVALIVV